MYLLLAGSSQNSKISLSRKYVVFSVQSIPNEFKENYEVSMITLEYRREVGKGDKVDSLARLEPCDGNNDISALEGLSQPQFIHLIRNQEGDEINKGRTVWRPVNDQAVQQDPISPWNSYWCNVNLGIVVHLASWSAGVGQTWVATKSNGFDSSCRFAKVSPEKSFSLQSL